MRTTDYFQSVIVSRFKKAAVLLATVKLLRYEMENFRKEANQALQRNAYDDVRPFNLGSLIRRGCYEGMRVKGEAGGC